MTGPRGGPAGMAAERAGSGISAWTVLPALMLATLLANVASVGLFPQIVTLSTEFDRPVNQVVWTIIAFHVVATGVGGVVAALGAVAGNRRMLMVTIALLLGGSLMAALSTDLLLLIAGRIVQGGSMAAQALSIGIVANYWRGDRMRRAMSAIVLSMAMGAVIAYLSSGFIWRAGGDWRTLFWMIVGGAAIDLLLIAAFVKETKRFKGVSIDFLGCAGLVVWAVLILVPLSQANSWGWASTKLLGLLLPGLAMLGLWVWWELRRVSPLVDLRVLKLTGVWQGAVVWLAITMGMCVPATVIPYLFQTPAVSGFGFGTSIFAVSLVLAVPAMMMALVSPTSAPLMRRIGPKRTALAGVLFGLGGFGLAFAHSSIPLVVVWLALSGVTGAWAGSASYAVAAEAVPPERGILISTIYNTAGGSGAAVASAVAGYVLTVREVVVPLVTPDGVESRVFPADETITWSALIVGAFALAAILSVLTIKSKHVRDHGPGADAVQAVVEPEV